VIGLFENLNLNKIKCIIVILNKFHMSKQTSITVEQEVQCGNCICPPPIAFLTEDTHYHIKENGNEIGTIKEGASTLCKVCCPSGCRTGTGKIHHKGQEYHVKKQFRCSYLLNWLCCDRPDMIVERNGKVVGSVELPCYPTFVCKIEVKCYRGDKRDEAS
jgi:hypothetical protein